MNIAPFETEHFYAKYEFNTPYQLCNSDCETVSVGALLDMADMSLEQFGLETMGYTESQGNPHLRELIAGAYGTLQPDDVMLLGTPVEGIYLTARALLEPGDEVVVLTPAYDALINLFEHVVNPTGYLPSVTMQQELAQLVEERDLWLFYDEMYFGLVHSGTPPIPSMADVTKKAIVLSGLSKTYGLPGLRTGWLVVQDEAVRDHFMNWKFYTSICPPAPSEFLAVAAMRVWETLRDKNIAQVEQNLTLAESFFARWPDHFTWRRPMAGSTALVGYNVPSVTAVSEQLAQEAGVLIHPGTTLGTSLPLFWITSVTICALQLT